MTTEERKVQSALMAALQEPSVPESLIQRTVCRCRAVNRGREAEEQLAVPHAQRTPEETAKLLACGLLGRLAQDVPLPEQTTVESAVRKILADRNFQSAVRHCDPATALQDGSLLRRLTAASRQQPSVPTAEPKREKQGPVR